MMHLRDLLGAARPRRMHTRSDGPRPITIIAPANQLLHGPSRDYSSRIPSFKPMMAACVRLLALNLWKMLLTRLLTVSCVIDNRAAISLFALPAAISRST